MKPKFYYNDTWRQGYLFFIGFELPKMMKHLERNFGITSIQLPASAGGSTHEIVDEKGQSILIIWTEKKSLDRDSLATLAHECVHATNRTCYNRGYKIDAENDEAYAYLFTIIFENALKELK